MCWLVCQMGCDSICPVKNIHANLIKYVIYLGYKLHQVKENNYSEWLPVDNHVKDGESEDGGIELCPS